MSSSALANLVADLGFAQSHRLLQLDFDPGAGLDANVLLPYELAGEEGLSEGFTYQLLCLSTDAFIELKSLIGVPVQISLLTDGGTTRALCGLVTQAKLTGSDGGFSRYLLTLQDPLAVLAKRINSRVFQDLSVREFVAQILQEHQQTNPVLAACFNWEDRCTGAHSAQGWVTQYNESDAAFIGRWLAQEGINWYVEHGEAGTPGEHPKMTLVLFDDIAALEGSTAGKVRFHRDDGTEAEDSITTWRGTRTLQPGKIRLASYEYRSVITNTQQDDNSIQQGETGADLASTLEDNRYQSHHSANDERDFARYGKLRMGAHEFASKCFTGMGSHRELAVGRHFELADHPVHDQDLAEDRQFTVLRTTLYARNNLPEDEHKAGRASTTSLAPADLLANSEASGINPVYRVRFAATRKHVPIIPAFSHTTHAKPVAPSLLTAVVVGPPGEEIHVNELGCIKVRMPFTRPQDQVHAEGAGASDTDRDSLWIRVAQPWTGSQYGHLWIPRVGDEVLVQFIQDDIDRPIVTGSVANGTHQPATFSNAGNLPGNKALSGIKSKMYRGSGANEIVWDDSTGEQRIRVATDHAATALNQGYLVHPRVDGKGEPRGEGLELRTDAYGAIRAGKGMLITTDAREHARSQHLDSKELTTQLAGSVELAKALSDAAKGHNAQALDVNVETERLLKVAQATTTQSGGTGQQAVVPAYDEPILAFSSPAGIVSATPKSQQIAAGEHLHLSSQQDTNLAVGKRLAIAIKEAWSVFVATSGIKLFAGKGKVEIQAQGDNIEFTAKQDVKLSSVTHNIDFAAAKSITLTAGGCQIKLAGGTIDIKAPGPVNIHGATKNLTGPASANMPPKVLPQSEGPYDEQFQILDQVSKEPVAYAKYKVETAEGRVFEGITDKDGKTLRIFTKQPEQLKVFVL